MFGMLPFERHSDNMFDLFDDFERSFFGKSGASLPDFRTDIRDDGDSFVLESELPGFAKEDITLDVRDGILTVCAKHKADQERKDGSYIRRERRYGSFQRSFDISGIDQSGITAAYRDGVLELTLPKAKPTLPESRRIAIE